MIDILDTNNLRIQLTKELSYSSSVILLSAYISSIGIDWLVGTLPSHAELVVVGRFIPRDFKSGSSDISAIRNLLQRGFEVKALSTLHAKIITINDETMFLGSANYTGRGLGLLNHHNLEASVRLKLSSSSKSFIHNIVDAAFNLTLDKVDRLEEYLLSLDEVSSETDAENWPIALFDRVESLFVKDFPLAKLGEYHDIYNEYPNSDFSRIYNAREDHIMSKSIFINSRSYIWLLQLLSKEENLSGLSFGKLSHYIHNALLDDPAPYRKTVKEIQANFYTFIKEYASDIIQFYMPGNHSEFIRLKEPNSPLFTNSIIY